LYLVEDILNIAPLSRSESIIFLKYLTDGTNEFSTKLYSVNVQFFDGGAILSKAPK